MSVILICMEKRGQEESRLLPSTELFIHKTLISSRHADILFPQVWFPVTQTAMEIGWQEGFGEHCQDRSLRGNEGSRIKQRGSQQVTVRTSADPKALCYGTGGAVGVGVCGPVDLP